MKVFSSLFLLLLFLMNDRVSNAQPKGSFKPKVLWQTASMVITQIAPHSFVHTSYLQTNDFGKVPCNGLVICAKGEAIVFDTPTNDSVSNELIEWIRNFLKASIVAVVPTHFHNDCLGGLNAFHQQQIPSFANNETIQLAGENNYTLPQKGFSDSIQLRVGNNPVVARYFGAGHTRDNIVGYFAPDRILFGGCLLKEMNATKGYLGDAVVPEWSATVARIRQTYPDLKIVVPGHGAIGGKNLLDYTIGLFKNQQ